MQREKKIDKMYLRKDKEGEKEEEGNSTSKGEIFF